MAAAIWPGVAMAADFDVDTTADGDDRECVLDCTLREAVTLAGSGDQVNLRPGNYVLTDGELVLNNDTIVGANARTTFIDGGDKSRVLTVIEVTSRVSGVTIRNGNGVGFDPDGLGGGIFIHSGTLLLQNSTVSGNTGMHGGGIAANGIAQLIGVTVSGNIGRAGRLTRGGGIATSATGGLLLGNSTVSGNTAVDQVGTASQGGGIHSAGALAIIASTIAGNSAAEGGGLYVLPPQTGGGTTLQNSLLSHGTGSACGGPGLGNLTATANVVSDDSCQFKDASNLQAVNPRIGTLADNGGPTNTHALLPASPAIGHAGSCAAQDQRLVTRVAPCDSGAFEYRAPTLKVVMQVVNDSGGTRTPSQFAAHVRLDGADVKGSPQPGNAEGTTYVLDAGSTYSVAADSVAGYALSVSGDCTANGSITLHEGQSRSCTITANDIAPTLRVVTNVVNDQGGTLGPASFTAHVRTGGIDVVNSPQPGSATGTVYTLSAGPTYAVAADAVAGYTLAVSGGCTAITLQLAQNATCTIAATDNPPTLRVITTVVNDNGGTLAPANFSAHVRTVGTDVSGSPQPGSATGTVYTLSAGATYTVAADPISGYALTVSGDCAANGTITMQLDQDRTCTITANDVGPQLRLITAVVNDNGGSRSAADFTAHVRSGPNDVAGSPQPGSGSGTTYTLSPGTTYTVAADGVPGYTFAITGDCSPGGNVTPQLGRQLTCTITANDIAPTLRVITDVVNDNGGDLEREDVEVHVRRDGVDVPGSPKPGAGPPGADYAVSAGSHAVAVDPEAGYSVDYGQPCGSGGAVTLALGQEATCTVTIDDGAATLTVATEVVNDDGGSASPSDFDVSIRQNGVEVAGGAGNATGAGYSLPGQSAYTVAGGGVPGYTVAISGDCGPDGSITLQLADGRACTITANDVAPRLTVITQVVNDHGGTATPGGFTVHVRRGGADVAGSPQPGSGSGTTYTLAAGAHTVAADAIPGYAASISGHCAGDGSITLAVGDSRTCTVTPNDDPPPPTAQPSVNAQQLPPPEPGKSVNALPKSGKVKVKLPGSAAYVDLDEAQQLPVGTIVDARKGHVTLIAASNASGGTATAEFWAGIFRLGQTKGRAPTTVLKLVEKLKCPKVGRATLAAKRKTKRRLWGNGSGKFRTRGKHSAATVVGTRWLVEDRCTSTLTRVVRGRVSVRDFAKKKTVSVRAGKKYVARAKKR